MKTIWYRSLHDISNLKGLDLCITESSQLSIMSSIYYSDNDSRSICVCEFWSCHSFSKKFISFLTSLVFHKVQADQGVQIVFPILFSKEQMTFLLLHVLFMYMPRKGHYSYKYGANSIIYLHKVCKPYRQFRNKGGVQLANQTYESPVFPIPSGYKSGSKNLRNK